MNFTYNKIFLIGFRATGKSSLGRILAQKINWDFIEMDNEIIKSSGKTIFEMTQGGIDWNYFRSEEHKLLHDLVSKENIVISTGGGLTVNKVKNLSMKKTYGELNTKLLEATPNCLIVGLTASEEIIKNRIKFTELKSINTRPLLDSNIAKQIKTRLSKLSQNPNLQKKVLISSIVKNSLQVFKQRSSKYAKLADVQINTGITPKEEAIKTILKHLHRGGEHVH